MGGKSAKVEETPSQKKLTQIAQADWDMYQTELKQANIEYLATVENQISPDKMQQICARNNLQYSAVFDQVRANAEKEMKANGVDPNSGAYQKALQDITSRQMFGTTDTMTSSQATQQDKHVAGGQDAIAIGQGEKSDALSAYADSAKLEQQRAIDDAKQAQEERKQMGALVGGALAGGSKYAAENGYFGTAVQQQQPLYMATQQANAMRQQSNALNQRAEQWGNLSNGLGLGSVR